MSVEGLAVLICTINGVSEVHNFTWYHNGELRLERTGERYINIEHDENVGMLSIHDITIEEAGNYTCIAHTSNTTTPLQESYILRLQGMYNKYSGNMCVMHLHIHIAIYSYV